MDTVAMDTVAMDKRPESGYEADTGSDHGRFNVFHGWLDGPNGNRSYGDGMSSPRRNGHYGNGMSSPSKQHSDMSMDDEFPWQSYFSTDMTYGRLSRTSCQE